MIHTKFKTAVIPECGYVEMWGTGLGCEAQGASEECLTFQSSNQVVVTQVGVSSTLHTCCGTNIS